jgi:hypothetical protein
MPDANKISIYAGPAVMALLADRRPGERSGSLNFAVQRYIEIVRRMMPALSMAQWCAVVDCLQGATFDLISLRGIATSLADKPDLAEKWAIDVVTLVQRVREMKFVELVALADVIERFGDVERLPIDDMRSRLEAAGARIVD